VACRSGGVRHVGLRIGPGEVELEAPVAASDAEGVRHHADVRRRALQKKKIEESAARFSLILYLKRQIKTAGN
jgi:hypothetical protein